MQDGIRLTQFSKGGGCGCKIAPGILQQMLHTKEHASFNALLVGNESNDDAAVFQIDDTRAIISTADFFLPIVDDAGDFGKIAAANAISDVYAMGGDPMMAVAILGWPIDKIPAEEATKVLEGARWVCAQAHIPLAGGHTIDSADPIFGLAVTGSVQLSNLKKNNTAKEGDHVFLTKPLGAGVLSTALKRGVLIPEHYNILLQQMTTLNDIGMALGKIEGVHSMTDVTGFGLLGHLIEMADGSNLSAELSYSSIKKIEGLDNYLQQRTIPDATFRNWNSYSKKVQFEKGVNVMEAFNVLPDPQTNGGLLVSVGEKGMDEVVRLFIQMKLDAYLQPVARFIRAGEKSVVVKP